MQATPAAFGAHRVPPPPPLPPSGFHAHDQPPPDACGGDYDPESNYQVPLHEAATGLCSRPSDVHALLQNADLAAILSAAPCTHRFDDPDLLTPLLQASERAQNDPNPACTGGFLLSSPPLNKVYRLAWSGHSAFTLFDSSSLAFPTYDHQKIVKNNGHRKMDMAAFKEHVVVPALWASSLGSTSVRIEVVPEHRDSPSAGSILFMLGCNRPGVVCDVYRLDYGGVYDNPAGAYCRLAGVHPPGTRR